MSKYLCRGGDVSPQSMEDSNNLDDAHPTLKGHELFCDPEGKADNSRYFTKPEGQDNDEVTVEEHWDNLENNKFVQKLLAEEEKDNLENNKFVQKLLAEEGQLREQDTQSSKRQKVA